MGTKKKIKLSLPESFCILPSWHNQYTIGTGSTYLKRTRAPAEVDYLSLSGGQTNDVS